MILVIDNYDSFTYNLVQYIGEVDSNIKVVRNDEVTVAQLAELEIRKIVISPGPGRPKDAGISLDVVKAFHESIPILGVCLGHQVIGEAFGGVITYAKEIITNKSSTSKEENKDIKDIKNSSQKNKLNLTENSKEYEILILLELAECDFATYLKNKLEKDYEILYTSDSGRVAHEMIVDFRKYKVYLF